MPSTLIGAARAALRLVLRVLYCIVVGGLAYASIAFMDDQDMMIVKAAITKGFLVFFIAIMSVILSMMFIFWRFKIHPVGAFNVLERSKDNATGLGIFLGCTVLGPCIVAASIFGAT